MKVLVVYSEATRRIRRLVGPMPVRESDHVGKGEAAYICDTTTPKHPDDIQAEVCAVAGPLAEDKYAIVDKDGTVIDVVIMDPACDDHLIHEKEGYQYIKSAEATKRAVYDAREAKFIEPAPTADEIVARDATLAKEAAQQIKVR